MVEFCIHGPDRCAGIPYPDNDAFGSTLPAVDKISRTAACSPGFTASGVVTAVLRTASLATAIAVFTFTGTGYRVLLPPRVSIQTSGK